MPEDCMCVCVYSLKGLTRKKGQKAKKEKKEKKEEASKEKWKKEGGEEGQDNRALSNEEKEEGKVNRKNAVIW